MGNAIESTGACALLYGKDWGWTEEQRTGTEKTKQTKKNKKNKVWSSVEIVVDVVVSLFFLVSVFLGLVYFKIRINKIKIVAEDRNQKKTKETRETKKNQRNQKKQRFPD